MGHVYESQLYIFVQLGVTLGVFYVLRKKYGDADNIYYSVTPQPMEDIFSGPGRSEEMDSLLFKNSDNPDCTLRLCGLQKLKV